MNCPSCGAPMRLANGNTNLRCEYCKSIVIAKADDTGTQFLDADAQLACPACSSPLWNSVLAAIRLDACKQCHGLLVPMPAFEALIEKMRAEHPETVIPAVTDADPLARKVDCPRCHRRMDTHYYFGGGHAVISTCEMCELQWLDSGVLMAIVCAPHERDA
jgi:LSD1 subclass zinc finger protein